MTTLKSPKLLFPGQTQRRNSKQDAHIQIYTNIHLNSAEEVVPIIKKYNEQ